MTELSIQTLFIILGVLIVLSAFFSGSETALMRLNRYKLLHQVKSGHLGAKLAHQLLQKPDRLIGLILLGNNFINIFASSIATIIALRLIGESGIAYAAGILTFVILIFAEVAPKTWAAVHPERFAYIASILYTPLLKLLHPVVWLINMLSNYWLKVLGIDVSQDQNHAMENEELRTIVTEAGTLIPEEHKDMLLGILDLEKATVEDIMTPISDVIGIDLDDELNEIKRQLVASSYSTLPVFQTNIDNTIGVLRTKDIVSLISDDDFNLQIIQQKQQEPYFIPNQTSLYQQLINFQQNKRRSALVVNEYGNIIGLVTLQDVLEEVIGEFTTDPSDSSPDIQKQDDGTVLINGNITIRELNRTLHWNLPVNGPKTLNGLILEYLESIPEAGTSLKLYEHPLEIVQMEDNAVKLAKMNAQSTSNATN